MAYTLIAQAVSQAEIGTKYHVGIGITDPAKGLIAYGYVMAPGTKFAQRINTRERDQIINSSAALNDRDLATYPRLTQGDVSKGILQTTFIDPARVWDTDLELRVPGYVQLRPAWARKTKGVTAGAIRQVVPVAGDFAFTFAESNGNVYLANAGTSGSPTAAALVSLDTDGQYVYAGTAGGLWRALPTALGSWTQLVNAVNGTPRQWWVVNQGTAGFFAYYVTGDNVIYKHDLTQAFPQGAGAAILLPPAASPIHFVDLVAYQNGVAVLTNDISGGGLDVWFHDGINMTRILRLDGYQGRGLCTCLGDLYLSSQALSKRATPVLAKITTGTFTPIVEPAVPGNFTALQECLQPRSSSRYVYWPLVNASLQTDTTKAPSFIVQYDVITGAVSRLPVQDSIDFAGAAGQTADFAVRQVAAIGGSAALVFVSGGLGYLQYQVGAFGEAVTFQAAGILVTSHADFNTPGIVKQLRRGTLKQAPLRAGESISYEAHVDQDPAAFTTSLAPNPAGATVTQSTAGAVVTVLNLPQATLGHSMYRVLRLNGPGTSTPTVFDETVEITTGWTWEMTLDCTSWRQNLDTAGGSVGGNDTQEQGLRGKDLYFLLNNAYENAQTVTFYHPNGQSFTAQIDDFEADSETPMLNRQGVDRDPLDFDCYVRVILKQTLE